MAITVTTSGPILTDDSANRESILTTIKKACPFIGLAVPDAVFSSTLREHVELQEIAWDAAKTMARAYDWQKLKAQATLTGDGSSVSVDFPANYDRMLKKSQVWSSALDTPLTPIMDHDEWLGLDVQAYDLVINAWTIYGGQMHFNPVLANAATVKFFYISAYIVADSGNAEKSSFTEDTDQFLLDPQALKLAIIWRWKQSKGLPYAEDMQNYEDVVSRLISHDKGSRLLRFGKSKKPRGVTQAYPQTFGV